MTPAADPHLPQPLWFKDYAVDVEQADPDSMFALYHAALAIRQESLTATRDTTAEQVDMGADVVAYTPRGGWRDARSPRSPTSALPRSRCPKAPWCSLPAR